MTSRPSLSEVIDPDWATALEPVSDTFDELGTFLRDESRRGRTYQPTGNAIVEAFVRPMANVKVLVVGQDPYPTPGHAMGLSFSVPPAVRPVPRSLENIFRELTADLNVPLPANGDLRPWADQGVLLLNRVLTVESGNPGSHRGKGWETVTDQAIRSLVERGTPLVAILWGRDAATAKPLLGRTPIIESAHPSPLSASRGFFKSRPFSRANDELVKLGATPIDWTLPAA